MSYADMGGVGIPAAYATVIGHPCSPPKGCGVGMGEQCVGPDGKVKPFPCVNRFSE